MMDWAFASPELQEIAIRRLAACHSSMQAYWKAFPETMTAEQRVVFDRETASATFDSFTAILVNLYRIRR